jgi:hypothetical protein
MTHAKLISKLMQTIGSAALASACLAMAASAAAPPSNHFKPSSRDVDAEQGDSPAEERWTIQQYEDKAAANPVPGAAVGLPVGNSFFLVSQCRALTGVTYAGLVAGETDAIVGDTAFAFLTPLPGVASTCFNPQNEQNIVVNPANANNIVTSANEYRGNVQAIYVTNDRGASWRNIVLPGWTRDSGGSGVFSNMDSCGDPVLAFSPDGSRVYFAGLVCNFDGPGRYQQRSGVAVATSADGGTTWSAPNMVHYTATGNFFHDKEWITVGPDGTVHVTWTWFQGTPNGKFGSSPIFIASSHNGGQSWTGPTQVSDASHPFNQGSTPAVAPNGTIYVSYIASTPESGFAQDAMVLARSSNGGNSWTNVQGPRIYDDLNCYPFQLPGTGQGRQTKTAQNYRISSFPAMAVDPSSGRVHLAWTDDRAHPSCGSASPSFNPALGDTQDRVYYTRTDDGVNFTAPTALTAAFDDNVYPAVAARGGKVVVGYYTRKYAKTAGGFGANNRCSVRVVAVNQPPFPDGTLLAASFGTQTNVCIDYAAKVSTDAGASFGSETRLSSESSNPWTLFTGSFIGDYTGVAIDALGRGMAVWTDFRGNPGSLAPAQITPANQDAMVRFLP